MHGVSAQCGVRPPSGGDAGYRGIVTDHVRQTVQGAGQRRGVEFEGQAPPPFSVAH